MELQAKGRSWGKWGRNVLQWFNLRPEESNRTLLMLGFYTCTCIGLMWAEASTMALFLGQYGADALPWIYIANAGMGSGLGFLYSWLQTVLPLRRVIVVIALLMALPLMLLRLGLEITFVAAITVFLLRLWVEAINILNDLNTSITANQLFNIREIKRTYPLISSGVLVADVLSGFSLPIILTFVPLKNVIVISSIVVAIGAGILFYLSQTYRQFFPDSLHRRTEEAQQDYTSRRLAGPIRQYVIPLIAFFIISQAVLQLVEFQFFGQLEQRLDTQSIASFLGFFNGVLGICELAVQWFISSRLIERLGVFIAAALLPGLVGILGLFCLTPYVDPFTGLIVIKFFDELLRYTLVLGTGPALFQPLPESMRNLVQSWRGIAEPLSIGATGLMLLLTNWVCVWLDIQHEAQIFLIESVALSLAWLVTIGLLRSGYVKLLVTSAESGRLGVSDVDLGSLKRAVAQTLEQPGREEDKRSCIELLNKLYPQSANHILVPLLPQLAPALQRQSLEVMLEHPDPGDLHEVRVLMNQSLPPEVLAVALRYVWLTEPEPDLRQLRPYLQPEVDPIVRSTAASLILRRGTARQKAEATNTIRRMVTSEQERERVMGCRALGEAVYMQALRLYIPNLLQDESLRVRCALLEAIAATHLEEYYPSLLRGLQYQSTRDAALKALVRLENEAVPLLLSVAEDPHKPDLVRMYTWNAIAQIATPQALDALSNHLVTSWGATRRNILRTLLKIPDERGIEGILDRLGRSGIELLIDQELMFLGQTYAALIDLSVQSLQGREADLLRRAFRDLQDDAVERCFLLMKFLYPISSIQAAAFNLQSNSVVSMARGLEILDNTLDIRSKKIMLTVLDQYSDAEKLESLGALMGYRRMSASDRLRHLLDLRYFLSDWALACCFHLARQYRWSVTPEQVLMCLRHPTGFVREAVLAYLQIASERTLVELLPMLKNDPNPLVRSQVQALILEFGISHVPASELTSDFSDHFSDFGKPSFGSLG